MMHGALTTAAAPLVVGLVYLLAKARAYLTRLKTAIPEENSRQKD